LSRGFGLADFVTYFTTEGRCTVGEPFRIVSGGVGPIPGDTVLDKRAWATENFDHSGIVGTRFAGRVVEEAEVAGVPAVITEVEGSAQLTGHHRFVLERDDPSGPGFLLR
jgi:proline racemase